MFVRVIVWVLLGLLAWIVLPICALLIVGLIRRVQIARTRRELTRLGFVGSVPREPRRLWPLVEAGLIGVVALIIATVVLPGPLAGRMLASTDGSPFSSPSTHAPVAPPSTSPGSAHTASDQPATTHGAGNPPASIVTPVSPAANAGGDAGAPSTVTAHSTSATAIHLEWAPVTGAVGYHVERSTDTVRWDVVASTTSDQTQYTDAALASGTTYYYRVAAVAGEGVSRSDVVSATTVETPQAPVLLSATGSTSSVDLAWSDVDGELSYQIERSPDGTSGWAAIGTTGQDVTSYTDKGLTATTTYYYRVVAVTSDGGSSPPSVVLAATTGPGDLTGGPSTSGANADPSIAPTAP